MILPVYNIVIFFISERFFYFENNLRIKSISNKYLQNYFHFLNLTSLINLKT